MAFILNPMVAWCISPWNRNQLAKRPTTLWACLVHRSGAVFFFLEWRGRSVCNVIRVQHHSHRQTCILTHRQTQTLTSPRDIVHIRAIMPQKIGTHQRVIAKKPVSFQGLELRRHTTIQWRKSDAAYVESTTNFPEQEGQWCVNQGRDHVSRLQRTPLHKTKPSFCVHQFGHNFSLSLE